MLQKHIFKTVLFSSFLSVVSSNIPICLTWRQHNNYLQFVCHVDDLHLSVTLTDPANDELAWCLIPLPHGKCLPLVPWVNVTQNLATNETVFSVQNKNSSYINGNWTCQHGFHGDEALIEVNILDTVRGQKSAILTSFVWSFAGVGMTYLIIEIGSLFWKYNEKRVIWLWLSRRKYSKRMSKSGNCCVQRLRCVSIFVFVIASTLYAGIITIFTVIPYEDNELGRGLFVLLGIVYAILVFLSSQCMSFGHRHTKGVQLVGLKTTSAKIGIRKMILSCNLSLLRKC